MTSSPPTIVSLRRHTISGGQPSLNNPSPQDLDAVDANMSDNSVFGLFLHVTGTQTPSEDDLKGLTVAAARALADAQGVPKSMDKRISVSTRWTLSDIHIAAAMLNARMCGEVENDPTLEKNQPGVTRTYPPGDRRTQHICYAIGAVALAFAAIEAAVAESFIVATETYRTLPTSDIAHVVHFAQMAALWETKSRMSTLELARTALKYTGKSPDDIPSWADAPILRTLRNDIVHYHEGSTVIFSTIPGVFETEVRKLEQDLVSRGLNNNPFAIDTVYPFQYLGYKTAQWAVDTARNFIEQYYRALNMQSPLNLNTTAPPAS